MQTNKHITIESKLGQAGRALLQAAYDYWKLYQQNCGHGAVVWVADDCGHFVLFTRGEYKQAIMAAANCETLDEPALFEPFTQHNAAELEQLREALRYVSANHHEGSGEFEDIVQAALSTAGDGPGPSPTG